MNLREHKQDINNIDIFFHKVTFKGIVFTHPYLMVSVRTVKSARCKTKIQRCIKCHRNGLYRQKYRYHSRSNYESLVSNKVMKFNKFYLEFVNESKTFLFL